MLLKKEERAVAVEMGASAPVHAEAQKK